MKNKNPKFIYYNVTMSCYPNNPENYSPNEAYAKYNVALDETIIDHPEDYCITVSRMSLPGNSIPILLVPVKQYQLNSTTVINTNPALTNYMISFRNGGGVYTRDYVVWSPENQAPTPVYNNGWPISSYWYCYSYQYMINLINQRIAILWSASGFGGQSPWFKYDATTQLISLIIPYTMITSNITMYVNYGLWNLLQNFNYSSVPVPNTFLDEFQGLFQFNTFNVNYNDIAYPPVAQSATITTLPAYLEYKQELPALSYWNSFRNILVSLQGPIVQEYLQVGQQNLNSGNTNSIPILLDFLPTDGNNRDILQYTPTSLYKLVDMLGKQPLDKINIQLFYLDTNNNLIPLLINVGQVVQLKLMFVRNDVVVS